MRGGRKREWQAGERKSNMTQEKNILTVGFSFELIAIVCVDSLINLHMQ